MNCLLFLNTTELTYLLFSSGMGSIKGLYLNIFVKKSFNEMEAV